MEQKPNPERAVPVPDEPILSPHHGFQGDRGLVVRPPSVPAGLTITISREAGARGGSIGRRVGRLLGWQVYDQELLEYIAQEGAIRQDVVENLAPAVETWCRQRLDLLIQEYNLGQNPSAVNLARVILALGAQGQVVLIGRGGGLILPRPSTLNLRIIAPLVDRIGYMSQWLRLTVEEAAERVRLRDNRRAEFLATHFHNRGSDLYQYDFILNSSLLGEELCAELIVRAARAKAASLAGE
jgi:cytidylate kinase